MPDPAPKATWAWTSRPTREEVKTEKREQAFEAERKEESGPKASQASGPAAKVTPASLVGLPIYRRYIGRLPRWPPYI